MKNKGKAEAAQQRTTTTANNSDRMTIRFTRVSRLAQIPAQNLFAKFIRVSRVFIRKLSFCGRKNGTKLKCSPHKIKHQQITASKVQRRNYYYTKTTKPT